MIGALGSHLVTIKTKNRMILHQREDGAIVSIDTFTGKSITITQSEIEDFKCEPMDDYTKEWRDNLRSSLTPFALSEFSICLIINGRFDHNKRALETHLKRVNRESYLERIWALIK